MSFVDRPRWTPGRREQRETAPDTAVMAAMGAMACVLLCIPSGCVTPPGVLPRVCGDGIVNEGAGEQCDDQGPSATCDIDCTWAVCGDGTVNPAAGEECDDGNPVPGDGCDPDCRAGGACGDGTLDPGESCDDGNTTPGDGCSADCWLEGCGNGVLEPGETCDEHGMSTATCDGDCTPVTCGDGVANPAAGEQCDDAGMSAVCDYDCTVALCGDLVLNPLAGEECDGGLSIVPCNDDCTLGACGDGLLDPATGEQCDDGNRADGDGCSGICQVELACGNGVLDPGEDVDPAPGPSPSVPADALTCRYDFSSITQLYCMDICGNWGGGNGCQQADADALCKLRMDNPGSTAVSFTVSEALAAPGICCPPPVLDDPALAGCVPLGVLADRGVALAISVHETDLLGSHGAGDVVTGVVCTDP